METLGRPESSPPRHGNRFPRSRQAKDGVLPGRESFGGARVSPWFQAAPSPVGATLGPVPVCEKAQGVDHHQQRRALMKQYRDTNAHPQYGCRNKDSHHA